VKVKAVVMCHNTPDTTARLWSELSGVFDVSVIDSGSDPEHMPLCPDVERCENLYWTGCWNKAIDMVGDADVLWVLGGDLELRAPAGDYLEAIRTAMPFGCWSPAVVGRCRPLMDSGRAAGRVLEVWHLEGMGMAVSREALEVIGRLPEENRLGWGLDIWMCWKSWKADMRNVLDGRVRLFHPAIQGYGADDAWTEMGEFFSGFMGAGWRNELRYWSDDFDKNVRGERADPDKADVTVVVASYNQRRTIELTLETLSQQSVVPIQVIVSDDGSSDGTLEWLDSIEKGRYPFEIEYVTREHDGYNLVGVNNNAAPWVRGKRVLFTNGDILHCRTSVESHAGLPEGAIGGGLISGVSLPASDAVIMEDVVDFERVERLSKEHPPQMTNSQYWEHDPAVNPRCKYGVWGGNYSAPTALWRELGFNPEYHLKYGGEEADFIERATKAGACVAWARGSISYHLEHKARTYRKKSLGNVKYRQEYLT
jgi:GT2 family glycosyltransferase